MDQTCPIGGYPTKEDHDMPMMYTHDQTCNFTIVSIRYYKVGSSNLAVNFLISLNQSKPTYKTRVIILPDSLYLFISPYHNFQH